MSRASGRSVALVLLGLAAGACDLRAVPAAGGQTRPAADTAGAVAAAGDRWRDSLRAVEAHIDRLAAADSFAGVVLVARAGEPVLHRAWGLADRERDIPNTLETPFNLGSMNKMATAVAVAQLVEQGRLAWHEPIVRWLPDYPDADVARRVTPHHLLTHTSGLGNYFGPAYDERRASLVRLADYLPLFAGTPLAFEPGARHEYSNAGYLVLGLLVERITGRSYYDHVREAVYAPAGMARAGFYDERGEAPRVAVGYTQLDMRGNRGGARRPNTDLRELRGSSAGGGFATAMDLLRFANALQAHRLLSVETTRLVLAGKTDLPQGRGRYGYGFFDLAPEGHRVIGHSGGFPGTNGDLQILPDDGWTIVVLTNQDPPAAQRVASRLRRALLAGTR